MYIFNIISKINSQQTVLLTFSFGLKACIRLLHLAKSLSILLTCTM